MTAKGVCGPPPNNLPGQMVVASTSSEEAHMDDTTRALLKCDVTKGDEKGAWWCGLRDSCYVGVYCSHESSEVFTEEKGFPKMQMFAQDPKNILPRRVCSRPNHAWVVAVGDSLTHPTFFDFLCYCKSIQVHVERGGKTSFLATVTDSNWELSTRVEK
jgi:hypothetical protein